ncbi:MAG: hypothetical protein JO182_30745 [Acidobacteriaceae bacterium]|nr:hypothetical protein [Acidobacteriaceae bacterium]MBV9307535.1 hypothetical protein [Acidobacteriaceae bacterium]
MTAQEQYTEHLIGLRRAEVASELEQQGYKVEMEVPFDSQRVDLIARKQGAKPLVYEFTLPANLHTSSRDLVQLRRAAADKGFDFKLVIVTPPRRIDVHVDGLEQRLSEALRDDVHQTSLTELATHVIVDGVSDVEITSLTVRGGQTDVEGQGLVSVTLEYGGGAERDGVTNSDSFPFDFDITLNAQREIVNVRMLEVDTSSFYE